MALVYCRECNNKVSSSARTCPHCGIENPAPQVKPPPPGQGASYQLGAEAGKAVKGFKKFHPFTQFLIVIFVVPLLIVVPLAVIRGDGKATNTKQAVDTQNVAAQKQKAIEVDIVGHLDSLITIMNCRSESTRILKCTVSANHDLDGNKITAAASRYDSVNGRSVDLPPALVNAGYLSKGRDAEITIMAPDGATHIWLSSR